MPETKLESVNCYSCDQTHQDVELHEYKGQQPTPFTHWFTCSVTGDAVQITIASFNGSSVVVNPEQVMDLVAAQQTGKYVFCVVVPIENAENGEAQVLLKRSTVNFPHSHIAAAIRAFSINLNSEIGPPQGEPMKAAPLPDQDEPLAQLFGQLRGNSDGK